MNEKMPRPPRQAAYGVKSKYDGFDPCDGHKQLIGLSIGKPKSPDEDEIVKLFTEDQMLDYAKAYLASQAQQQTKLPPEWEKNVSRMWKVVREWDVDIPSDDLDLMRQILLQSQAQKPTQEPVAWMNPHGGLLHVRETGLEKATFTIPLYTLPPAPEGE